MSIILSGTRLRAASLALGALFFMAVAVPAASIITADNAQAATTGGGKGGTGGGRGDGGTGRGGGGKSGDTGKSGDDGKGGGGGSSERLNRVQTCPNGDCAPPTHECEGPDCVPPTTGCRGRHCGPPDCIGPNCGPPVTQCTGPNCDTDPGCTGPNCKPGSRNPNLRISYKKDLRTGCEVEICTLKPKGGLSCRMAVMTDERTCRQLENEI